MPFYHADYFICIFYEKLCLFSTVKDLTFSHNFLNWVFATNTSWSKHESAPSQTVPSICSELFHKAVRSGKVLPFADSDAIALDSFSDIFKQTSFNPIHNRPTPAFVQIQPTANNLLVPDMMCGSAQEQTLQNRFSVSTWWEWPVFLL